MKLNKILSLGAVLGAILSVGMITSAMAEAGEVDPNFEAKSITAADFPTEGIDKGVSDRYGEYVFYGSKVKESVGTPTVTAADTIVEKYGDVDYAKVIKVKGLADFANDGASITLSNTGMVAVHVDTGCYLTVALAKTGGSTGGSCSLYKYDGSVSSKLLTTDGAENVPSQGTKSYDLTTPGNYYLTGDSKSVHLEEIEIRSTDKEPSLIVIDKGRSNDTPNGGSDPIAVVKSKDGSKYYAVALMAKDKVGNWNTITITSKDNPSVEIKNESDSVYEELLIDGVYYDANYFGSDCHYLYAVTLEGTGGTTLGADNEGQIKSEIGMSVS